MPQSYRNFIKSMLNQQRLSLQSLITDLIQEETLMKSLNSSIASISALYVGKRNLGETKENSSHLKMEKERKYSHQKVMKGILRLVSTNQK